MKRLILCLFLATGCASAPITYQPDPTQPAVLTVDPELFGRGAIYVEATADKLEVTLCQDGTSDWSVSRLVAWIGDVAGTVFGGGGQTAGMGMAPPDPLGGCGQLFGTGE